MALNCLTVVSPWEAMEPEGATHPMQTRNSLLTQMEIQHPRGHPTDFEPMNAF